MKPGHFESLAAIYILMIAASFIFVWGRYDNFALCIGAGFTLIGDAFIFLSKYSRSPGVK